LECLPKEIGTPEIVESERLDLMDTQDHAILVECILNCIKKGTKTRFNKESDMGETIPLLKYAGDEGTDSQWSTVLLLLPHSSTFYVAHQGGSVDRPQMGFNGMPMSWLRIHRRENQPAKGAFIKSIQRTFHVSLGR
jgi:hypothetical protein